MPFRAVADLLVPLRCAGCDRPADRPLCPACAAALAALALADRGVATLAPGVGAVGAYRHDGTARTVLLAAKLRGRHAVLPTLAALLRARLALPAPRDDLAWTWVPAGPRTRRRHGVEVPRALAGPAAVPLLALSRAGGQTGLAARGRRRGGHDRFRVVGQVPPTVIVVDDVRTTGATARAAGHALRDAGASRVLVATFSVTPDPADATREAAPARAGGRAPA